MSNRRSLGGGRTEYVLAVRCLQELTINGKCRNCQWSTFGGFIKSLLIPLQSNQPSHDLTSSLAPIPVSLSLFWMISKGLVGLGGGETCEKFSFLCRSRADLNTDFIFWVHKERHSSPIHRISIGCLKMSFIVNLKESLTNQKTPNEKFYWNGHLYKWQTRHTHLPLFCFRQHFDNFRVF